ncbi:MAG: hypothetical protein ABSE44_20290, partial [Candidatus Sulfotelmatobacter sp.]
MTRTSRILAAVACALSVSFSYAVAQQAPRSGEIPPPAIVAIPTPTVLSFHAAAVGISLSSAQKLTVSFAVSGYSGSFKPTATMHYGHDYVLGTPSCTGSGSSETC